MPPSSSQCNIYLTGFMGCGKSTVGKILAAMLRRPFIDADRLIAARAGMDIPKIFKKMGEAHFRALETRILMELTKCKRLVVALGGGAILRAENRRVLSRGHWIFLNTPFTLIRQRLLTPSGRPLARGTAQLAALYQSRLPLYHLAHRTIDCGTLAPDAIARHIARNLP